MFEVEYLWNHWLRKDKVNANLIEYNCHNLRNPIDFAFSTTLLLIFEADQGTRNNGNQVFSSRKQLSVET